MNTPLHRAALCLRAALLILVTVLATPCQAGLLEFTGEAPAFTVALPEKWTGRVNDGDLQLFPTDEDNIVLSFSKLKRQDGEYKATAEGFAQGVIEGNNFKEGKLGKSIPTEIGGLKAHVVEWSGKYPGGGDASCTVTGFAIGNDVYVLYRTGTPAAVEKYKGDIAAVVGSLKVK